MGRRFCRQWHSIVGPYPQQDVPRNSTSPDQEGLGTEQASQDRRAGAEAPEFAVTVGIDTPKGIHGSPSGTVHEPLETHHGAHVVRF